ncbi:MAG: SIS domain-containing protein [Aquiluna sp.]|jgi:fructoselysine-6-P-deglycase FrlB-like protein
MTSHAETEIFSQPEIWEQTIAFYPKVAALLPKSGERVAFVGCGTSWFMSMAVADMRESMGLGESDAFTASEFPLNRKYDRIVAISRSGTTTEVVDLLSNISNTPTVIITAVAGSPVTEHADETVLLDFADEESVLQTRYATAVLALMRTHFGEDISHLAEQCRTILGTPLDAELLQVEQISFLGTGWTIGLANEAALKTRESSQFWAEAYPAMDYRHGPISIAQPGRAVWIFGESPAGLEKNIADSGALLVTSELDPMVHLVLAQRVAVAISEGRGLDTDNPRGLARSIVLN